MTTSATRPAAVLTPSQVSDRYQIPQGTLTQWRHRRVGPKFYRVGKHVRYLEAECDEWFAGQVVETA